MSAVFEVMESFGFLDGSSLQAYFLLSWPLLLHLV